MRRLPLALFLVLAVPSVHAQDPARAAALANQAQQLIREKHDYDGAVALAVQAIAADPNCAAAYAARGYARFKQAAYTSALEDYSHALELEPANPTTRLWRCQTYMTLDDWRSALEDVEAGMKVATHPFFLSLHGWARINVGEVDPGLEEMDRAAAENPGQPAYLNRFDANFFRADWKAMVEEAQRHLATGRPSTVAHFFQVKALVELGDFDAARKAAELFARGFKE